MTKNGKKKQNTVMSLQHRETMYHNEVREWLEKHPNATPPEIDNMYRRLASKWQI